jgi:two-component system, OmpR family, alkaline phosphatase synthesis response regulator PhoP
MSENENPHAEVQSPKAKIRNPAAAHPDAVSLYDRRLATTIAPAAHSELPASSPKPASRTRPLIMVVDDEPDIVLVTKTRIRLSGYDVAEAEDGAIALERIQELRPDLIVLDLKMPKLDGYQLCKTIKADPSLRDTLILVCSASSSLGLSPEKRCLQLGANGYMRKPYDVRKLLQEISRLLAQKKACAEAVAAQ